MSMRRLIIIIALLSGIFPFGYSQEKKPVTLNGYITTLQSATYDSLSGPFVFENIIHNRLNFKAWAGEKFSFAAEFRNRLFTGDRVRTGESYAESVGFDPGWVDMSWNIASKQSFILNTSIDRLWADYHSEKLQVTIGRQRINWGQTTIWNPNDIFNAYSFFDFDYIERPGSDAVRIQYFTSFSSAAELVIKADYENNITASGLYRFNKWGYDFQFLAGYVNSEDAVLGTGWSGSLGSVSFRGEASVFWPWEDFPVKNGIVIATTGFEKVFSDNSMAQVQVMYCNQPAPITDFGSFYLGTLSAKELAFSEFTAFGQFSWAVTPLARIGLAGMWFPDLKGFYAGPSFDYSLGENLDFSIIWQQFRGSLNAEKFRMNIGFLRLKYSF
jgi:hypothetical protein